MEANNGKTYVCVSSGDRSGYYAEYRAKNREKIAEYQKAYQKAYKSRPDYYVKNKEKLSAYRKKYYQEHKEARKAYSRRWYADNALSIKIRRCGVAATKAATALLLFSSLLLAACGPTEYDAPVDVPFSEFNN